MSEFNITGVSNMGGLTETTRSDIAHASTDKQGKMDTPVKIDKKMADALNAADPPIANPKSKDGKWKAGDQIFMSKNASALLGMNEVLNDKIEVKQGKAGPQVILGEPTITYGK